MDMWDIYQSRVQARGNTKRQASYNREVRMIQNKLKDNLSYQDVTIDDKPQKVAIINSDNLNEKTIISMPNEDIEHGGLVFWENNHWLVTEKDYNSTIYTKCIMIQCNHLLHWVTEDRTIHSQWCIIEDGTKLKYILLIYYSLAYWKRYVKTTS